jgi:ABC-2 type transport system permease protein
MAAPLRRIRSLATAELKLFCRNRNALVSALLMPVILLGAVSGLQLDAGQLSANALMVTALLGFVLLAAVYVNLVATYVARREELVLKRLRAGALSDSEILAGLASPAVVVALGQMALIVTVGAVVLGLPIPVNAPVLALGAVGGVVVFASLAAASAAFTRTAETAHITTLPLLVVSTLGSGLTVPLDVLPGPLAAVARLLPLTPVAELMRLGWFGSAGQDAPRDFFGVIAAAAVPTAILAVWVAVGIVAVRRWFRWEPRS